MRLSSVLGALALGWTVAATASTQGLYDLVKRHLPTHCEDFVFVLEDFVSPSNASDLTNDKYTISGLDGSITIQGNSLSALSTGLRRYLTDVAHVDIYWFIGSRLDQIASPLPTPNGTIIGESIVPWRYFFNTGTSFLGSQYLCNLMVNVYLDVIWGVSSLPYRSFLSTIYLSRFMAPRFFLQIQDPVQFTMCACLNTPSILSSVVILQ
jgi:hypothetical protein